MTQGSIADSLGSKLSDMYRDEPEIREDFATCFAQKTTFSREMLHTFKLPERSRLLTVRYAYVAPDMVLVHTDDITEDREAEQSLRESEALLSETQKLAQAGSGLLDHVTGVMQWSDNVYNILGLSEDTIPSEEAIMQQVHADDLERVAQSIEQIKTTPGDYQLEHRIINPDGLVRHIQTIMRTKGEDDGCPTDTRWIMQDVTRQKEDEASLVLSKEEAETANRAKSDFLSSMSHELRTPMNAILGFAQILELHPQEPLTEDQKDCVKHIKSGGNHLLELIDQVLDLSRIEAGKLNISLEEIALDTTLQECLRLIDNSAQERNLKVASDLGATHTIKVDYTRFKQVMLNLLSNAVKYNREGGDVTLTSEDTADNQVRVSVMDRGEGISEDDQGGLFEAFNRLGREASGIEGTGIGLTITKQLVEAMGGAIGYTTELGKGSTFWIEFPAAGSTLGKQPQTSEVSKTPEQPARLSTTATVLYIEDNPANLSLMETIIGRMKGVSMISAYNAELGMSMAEEHQPDLILMDINLPGMDGIAAMKVLSTIDKTRDIPVIAISAAAMKRDIQRGMAAGFKEYLTKPFNIPEIVKAIEKELGQ